MALRYCEVELLPPAQHSTKPPIKLWVVHVSEIARPSDAQTVEWFLLSTRPITCVEQAQECLRWYCLRWRIEDWHRVANHADDLAGQTMPDLPADVLFSDIEGEVLRAYAKKTAPAHPLCSAMPYA